MRTEQRPCTVPVRTSGFLPDRLLWESWTNDAEIKFKKNPNYVYKDKIWLAGIDVKVVEDAGTQMQLFENGETDYISLRQKTT